MITNLLETRVKIVDEDYESNGQTGVIVAVWLDSEDDLVFLLAMDTSGKFWTFEAESCQLQTKAER